jgi:hypothetical protein
MKKYLQTNAVCGPLQRPLFLVYWPKTRIPAHLEVNLGLIDSKSSYFWSKKTRAQRVKKLATLRVKFSKIYF